MSIRLLRTLISLGNGWPLCFSRPCAANALASLNLPRSPSQSVFRPLQANGTADDALASGRVVAGSYGMARRPPGVGASPSCSPILKDPYWVGCDYGVISEARRLGVAVDILAADGYDDLTGSCAQWIAPLLPATTRS